MYVLTSSFSQQQTDVQAGKTVNSPGFDAVGSSDDVDYVGEDQDPI